MNRRPRLIHLAQRLDHQMEFEFSTIILNGCCSVVDFDIVSHRYLLLSGWNCLYFSHNSDIFKIFSIMKTDLILTVGKCYICTS